MSDADEPTAGAGTATNGGPMTTTDDAPQAGVVPTTPPAAGPALDAAVCVALGWKPAPGRTFGGADVMGWWTMPGHVKRTPPVSTDDGACWRWVVPALLRLGWHLQLSCGMDGYWIAVFVYVTGRGRVQSAAVLRPAEAICRAALAAITEDPHG